MNWLPLAISIAALVVSAIALRVAWRRGDHSDAQWRAAMQLRGLDDEGPQERWRRPE